MKDFVSNLSICAFTSAGSVSVFWWIVIGLPLAGVVSVVLFMLLTLSVALWIGRTSSLSIGHVIREIETEPMLALARSPIRKSVTPSPLAR